MTNSGQNNGEQIKNNILSLHAHARIVAQQCPQIKPILPQTHWECLIGVIDYETAMLWCKDELERCALGYWPQIGMGPRSGEKLIPTAGVIREIQWAKLMQEKEEIYVFKDLGLMAQWLWDMEQAKED